MAEINSSAETDRDRAWNRLFLAIGGLVLASGSVVTFAEGNFSAGAAEALLSIGATVASYRMGRKPQ